MIVRNKKTLFVQNELNKSSIKKAPHFLPYINATLFLFL